MRITTKPPGFVETSICGYHGQKGKFSAQIVQFITKGRSIEHFTEIFAGTAAVSLETIRSGFVSPSNVVLIECGAFGPVLDSFCRGTFPHNSFRYLLAQMPRDGKAQDFLRYIAKQKPRVEYTLLLQAASFRGKVIGIRNGLYCTQGFRLDERNSEPCLSPSRDLLLRRMDYYAKTLHGATTLVQKAETVDYSDCHTVYADPPYAGTEGYSDSANRHSVLGRIPQGVSVYVSEYMPLSSEFIRLDVTRSGFDGSNSKSDFLSRVSSQSEE